MGEFQHRLQLSNPRPGRLVAGLATMSLCRVQLSRGTSLLRETPGNLCVGWISSPLDPSSDERHGKLDLPYLTLPYPLQALAGQPPRPNASSMVQNVCVCVCVEMSHPGTWLGTQVPRWNPRVLPAALPEACMHRVCGGKGRLFLFCLASTAFPYCFRKLSNEVVASFHGRQDCNVASMCRRTLPQSRCQQ